MSSGRVSNAGRSVATILLLAALIYPQGIDSEKSLLWCLPAYGAIAVALLLAAATGTLQSRGDLLCFATALVFAGYIAVRALTSPAAYIARPDFYCVLAALLVYALVTTVIDRPGFRLATVAVLVCVGVIHVIVGCIQRGFGDNLAVLPALQDIGRSSRANGLFVSPNHLAGSLEVLAPVALSVACWSRWRLWSKLVLGLAAALCYFGIVLTGSRGGYYSAVASLIVFAFFSAIVLRPARKGSLLKFGGIGLVLLAVAIIAGALFMQRSKPSSQRELFAVDYSRLGLWNAAVEQWKLAPIIGTGSGTYLFYGRQFRADRMQMDPQEAHNDYLHLLCEYGGVGAAVFLLFFFAHCFNGWRSFRYLGPDRARGGHIPLSDRLSLNIGALSAIGAYVVHSSVDFNLHIPANALLVAFVFGVIANPGIETTPAKSRYFWPRVVRWSFIATAIILLAFGARLFPGQYYIARSRAALEAEEPSDALPYAKKALAWDSSNPLVFFYIGRSLIALGRQTNDLGLRSDLYKEAVASFEEARRLSPLDGTYPLEIASVYDEVGLFREAEAMFQVAFERDPASNAVGRLYKAHRDAWNRHGGMR